MACLSVVLVLCGAAWRELLWCSGDHLWRPWRMHSEYYMVNGGKKWSKSAAFKNITPPRGQKTQQQQSEEIKANRFRKAIQYRQANCTHKLQLQQQQTRRRWQAGSQPLASRKWATQNEMKTSALLIIFMDTFFSGAQDHGRWATWRIRRHTQYRRPHSLGPFLWLYLPFCTSSSSFQWQFNNNNAINSSIFGSRWRLFCWVSWLVVGCRLSPKDLFGIATQAGSQSVSHWASQRAV